MDPFSQKFQNISNNELLAILDQQEDYTPEALEAARAEFDRRSISEDEIAAFQKKKLESIEGEAERQQKAAKKAEHFRNMLSSGFSGNKEGRTTRMMINLLAAVFGALSLLKLVKEFDLFIFMITDKEASWDMEMILYYVHVLFLPVAVVSFYMRKQTGWILLGVYMVLSICGGLYSLYLSLKPGPSFLQFEAIFPSPDPMAFIIVLGFYGGCSWLLCRPSLREVFSIGQKLMLRVAIGGLLYFLITIAFS